MSESHVTLTGNLTDDPELKLTPNGVPVASFRIAVTPRVRDGETWRDGETSFFRVNAWRDLGEHVADTLTKGDRAIVIGRLKARTWETPEGEKRTVVEVEADEVAPACAGPLPASSASAAARRPPPAPASSATSRQSDRTCPHRVGSRAPHGDQPAAPYSLTTRKEPPCGIRHLPAASRPRQQRRSVRAGYVPILPVPAACAFTYSFVALAELARVTAPCPDGPLRRRDFP
jgi:single-strand DNA-binding protein